MTKAELERLKRQQQADRELTKLEEAVKHQGMSVAGALARAFLLGTEFANEAQATVPLRKPLEGELAEELETVRRFVGFSSSEWHAKLLPCLARIEAALRAKGEPQAAALKSLTELEWMARNDGPPTLHVNKQLMRQLLEPIRAALEPQAAERPCQHWGELTIDRATGEESCSDCDVAAEPPEPRPIVVGSKWLDADGSAHTVTRVGRRVTCAPPENECWLLPAYNFSVDVFRGHFTWLSDPEPAAPAPELPRKVEPAT